MLRVLLLLLTATSVASAAPQIPLCPGLTVVTAVNQMSGDYESIKTVEAIGAEELRLKYSSEALDAGMFGTGKTVSTTLHRSVLLEDLRTATRYAQIFVKDSDELIPGTTAVGTSAAVLRDLRSKGTATLSISNLPGSTPFRVKPPSGPSAYDYFTTGTIERVGVVKMPVLVNDQRVELTAIHARGEYFGDQHEFFFLDDDANPLALKFRLGVGAIKPMAPELAEACAIARENGPLAMAGFESQCMPDGGDRDVLQVVKITHRCPVALPAASGGGDGSGAGAGGAMPDGAGAGAGGAGDAGGLGPGAAALEAALQETGKAEIYSIYFSFDSDAIRAESRPTLEEIAAVMRKHPEWKLAIHGHTDNVANDRYNLELSQRRAAAVAKALTRYGFAADRLSSTGHGEASPIDTNETLEGRAKNRRVELVRLP